MLISVAPKYVESLDRINAHTPARITASQGHPVPSYHWSWWGLEYKPKDCSEGLHLQALTNEDMYFGR